MKKRMKGTLRLLIVVMTVCALSVSVMASGVPSGIENVGGMLHNSDGKAIRLSSDGNDWYQEKAVLVSMTQVEAPEDAVDRSVFYVHFEYLVTVKMNAGLFFQPKITFRVNMLAVEDVTLSSGYRFLNCEGITVADYSNWEWVSNSVTIDQETYSNHGQRFEIDVTVNGRLSGDSTSRDYQFTVDADIEDHE